jgi:hypothetical protein
VTGVWLASPGLSSVVQTCPAMGASLGQRLDRPLFMGRQHSLNVCAQSAVKSPCPVRAWTNHRNSVRLSSSISSIWSSQNHIRYAATIPLSMAIQAPRLATPQHMSTQSLLQVRELRLPEGGSTPRRLGPDPHARYRRSPKQTCNGGPWRASNLNRIGIASFNLLYLTMAMNAGLENSTSTNQHKKPIEHRVGILE